MTSQLPSRGRLPPGDRAAKCAAVIPALNEAGRIGPVVRGVRRHLAEVIVVDDGSRDGTSEEAMGAGARVIRNDAPQGKGSSLLAGWKHAHDAGYEWSLCLDGDGQHDPDDCPLFLEAADRTGAQLIVGNRMPEAWRMPWLRRRVNIWMSHRISGAVERDLPDTQCGFRLMNLDAWSVLAARSCHFEIESEIICEFARAGYEIQFVPIRVIYSGERSKIRPLRDTVRWLRWWVSVK